MSIGIYAPDWPRTRFHRIAPGNFDTEALSPFEVSAATLGEAIRQFEAAFSVTVSPYDGTDPALPFTEGEPRRYFFYSNADADRFLIDIHIFRGTEEICPKQNLDYPLQNGDIVDMAGPLVC